MLDAIQPSLKEEEHFWHYIDKIVLDINQKQDRSVHTLSNFIIEPVRKYKF